MDFLQGRLQVALAEERLKDSVGRHHHREGSAGEWRVADITANELNTRGQTRTTRARSRPRQHLLGAIDTDEPNPGAAKRQGNTARAAAQLEDGSTRLQREVPPEGHVATAQRTRVLPVIERRVVVPPLVALHYDFCPTVA